MIWPRNIRQKLKEVQQLFDSEARRNNVYPLVPYFTPQPAPNDVGTSYVYTAAAERIPLASAPRFAGRPYRVTADVEIPDGGAEGVILAQGADKIVAPGNALFGRAGGPGVARLSINGKPAGETKIFNYGGSRRETMAIGSDLWHCGECELLQSLYLHRQD